MRDLPAVMFGVATRGFHLDDRCVLGHDDDGTHAEQPRRQCNRLRMVARRERDHTRLALRRRELRQRVVRAAKLERAHALEGLGLEEQFGAGHGVGGGGRQHGRLVGYALQAGMGGNNVVVGNRQAHGRTQVGVFSGR